MVVFAVKIQVVSDFSNSFRFIYIKMLKSIKFPTKSLTFVGNF